MIDEDAPMKIEDETLIRELEYSTLFDNLPEKFKGNFFYKIQKQKFTILNFEF